MSVCDFLFSTDMLVPNPRSVVDRLIATIGLPQPGRGAYVEYRDSGWDCVFALVNKSMTVGPTRLEIIGRPDDWTDAVDSHAQKIADLQGSRPAKTHATVIATPDLEAVGAHLRDRGVRHWYDTTKEPFDRIWLGVTEEAPEAYDPSADAGTFLEIIPSRSAAFASHLFVDPPPEPVDPAPGQMIRIVSRQYLVPDLDAALRTLSENIGWDAQPAAEDTDGTRSAVMGRNYRQGAALRLVQPGGDGTPSRFFRQWGTGPYTIRVAVAGLDSKAADLRTRGTAFEQLPATRVEPERLLVDPSFTGGTPFEFVEYGSADA